MHQLHSRKWNIKKLLTIIGSIVPVMSATAAIPIVSIFLVTIFSGCADKNATIRSEEFIKTFSLSWKKNLPPPAGSAVSDGTNVYVNADKKILSLQLKNGKENWFYNPSNTIEAPPHLHKGMIIAADTGGTVYCLTSDGSLFWTFQTMDKITGAPCSAGDFILLCSYDFNLYCINSSGELVWKYKTDNYINGSAVYKDGFIYIAGCDGVLHILDRNGCAVRKIPADTYIAASPAADNNCIYAGNYAGVFFCFSAQDGSELWKYSTEQPFLAAPVIGSAHVYAPSQDGHLYAFDRKNGEIRYRFDSGAPLDSSPLCIGESVVFGNEEGMLFFLDKTGQIIWSYNTGGPVRTPVFSRGKLLVTSGHGVLRVFTAE